MAWQDYHRKVHFDTTSNQTGTGQTIPISDLNLKVVPFSRSGSTVVNLFDGRKIKRIDGYTYNITLQWNQLTSDENDQLFNGTDGLLDLFDANDTLYFFPDPDNTANSLEVVADMQGLLEVVMDGGVRKRPSKLKLEYAKIDASPKTWITQ